MKILIACDKFKGAATAIEVCTSIAKGIKTKHPDYDCLLHPLADGGDGSIDIIDSILTLEKINVISQDPLGRPISTYYYSNGDTAFIELAKTSGIALLSSDELDPLNNSTYGTGLLIKDAIEKVHKRILLFLGGSCTNDMGIGIASALGYKFFDKQNNELLAVGKNLGMIDRFESIGYPDDVTLEILVDVDNPLYGLNGAAQIYAKQKGANPEQIRFLDDGMKSMSNVIALKTGKMIQNLKGGGSAGGISGGLYGLIDKVSIKSGFDLISSLTDLEAKLSEADFLITGEGKMDLQSLESKVIGNLAGLANKHNVPIIALVGDSDLNMDHQKQFKLKGVYTIMSIAKNLQDSVENTKGYLAKLAQSIDYNS